MGDMPEWVGFRSPSLPICHNDHRQGLCVVVAYLIVSCFGALCVAALFVTSLHASSRTSKAQLILYFREKKNKTVVVVCCGAALFSAVLSRPIYHLSMYVCKIYSCVYPAGRSALKIA